MYVLVRRDQSYGQIIVQTGHAILEATRHFLNATQEHPHVIICGIKSEVGLLQEQSKLTAIGIKTKMFYEPDIGNQATAFATEIIVGETRKYFKKYQLIKPPSV